MPAHPRIPDAVAMKQLSKDRWYEIRVGGVLGPTLLAAFPGLSARVEGSVTVLIGLLPDQAALHSILAEIEALSLELIEVRRR